VLNATAGAAVIVTRDRYTNDRFSVEYPSGWRVITSPTGAPPSVIFAAPGNCALIEVSSTPLAQPPASSSCDQTDIQTTRRAVTLGAQQIAVAGSAPADGWAEFLTTLDLVAASIKVGT